MLNFTNCREHSYYLYNTLIYPKQHIPNCQTFYMFTFWIIDNNIDEIKISKTNKKIFVFSFNIQQHLLLVLIMSIIKDYRVIVKLITNESS